MNNILTRQEVCQMLPFYVLGTLESDKMLACQNYLRSRADRNLLLQYRDTEEMAAQQATGLPLLPVPVWAKQQLMDRIRADCVAHWHRWPLRHRTWRIIPS